MRWLRWFPWRVWRRVRCAWLLVRYRRSFVTEDAVKAMQHDYVHVSVLFAPERVARFRALMDARDWSPAFREALLTRFIMRGYR
jgi:hypothetical protein